MISTSCSASFLRIANISSCLRITLAFSTSSDSAKAIRSVGLLLLSSWSFISCMAELWNLNRGIPVCAFGAGRGRLTLFVAVSGGGSLHLYIRGAKRKASAPLRRISRRGQNGRTITITTITIISKVGISLTSRQWRCGLVFRSSANALTDAEK